MEYPVLGGRPINKWKVVELKEELKRRNLALKGLKDDLVNRLHEAILSERERFEGGASNNVDYNPELPVKRADFQSNLTDEEVVGNDTQGTAKGDKVVTGVSHSNGPFETEKEELKEETIGSVEMSVSGVNETGKVDEVVTEVGFEDVPAKMDQEKLQETAIGGIEETIGSVEMSVSDINETVKVDAVVADDVPSKMDQEKLQETAIGGIDTIDVIIQEPGLEVSVETSIGNNEIAAPDNIVIDRGNVDLNPPLKDADVVGEPSVLEAFVGASAMEDETVVTQMPVSEEARQIDETKMGNEDLIPLHIDAVSEPSDLKNQVHEVSPNLGCQVKSESISTNTVYISENNELKVNLNADNVHLELNVSRPEMVQPSSMDGPPNCVDLHPLDDNKTGKNQGFVQENDDTKCTPGDLTKKIDTIGGVSSSILRLDHNLVGESTVEDVLEDKQTDLKHNDDNLGSKDELIDVPMGEGGSFDAAMKADFPPNEVENYAAVTLATEEQSFKDDVQSTPMELSEKNYVNVLTGEGRTSDDAARGELSPDKVDSFSAVTEEKCFQDDVKPATGDLTERNYMADEGRLEKISLDNSSGDDFMEDDVFEKKQTDSNRNSTKVAEKIELAEGLNVEVGTIIDVVGPDLSADKMESSSDKRDGLSVPQKRKSEDEETVGNKEPPKRQRKWKSENLDIPEMQRADLSLSTTHNDLLQKQKLTRSDSSLSGDSHKERVVPPSPKPPTDSLRIDQFLRPFTLKAVQELLARTGKVCSFWMDPIKTHCYVTYSSVEEAIETRNALYNLQWPPNGGRLLIVKFVDPQEVKLRLEAPPQSPSTPVSTAPSVPESGHLVQPPSSTSQRSLKQNVLPQTPTVSDPVNSKERVSVPPTPSVSEKVELPMATLDELFRRTRSTPRIYYLPLTDEQVSAKLTVRSGKKQQDS